MKILKKLQWHIIDETEPPINALVFLAGLGKFSRMVLPARYHGNKLFSNINIDHQSNPKIIPLDKYKITHWKLWKEDCPTEREHEIYKYLSKQNPPPFETIANILKQRKETHPNKKLT